MWRLEASPEQLQLAATNLARKTPFSAAELARLAYLADGDEVMMEDALGVHAPLAKPNLLAAEQQLCNRFLALD